MKTKFIFRRFASKDLGLARVIRASYPDKNWSLSTLQAICRQVDETGSAERRRAGSGIDRRLSVLLQLVNMLNTVFKY